MSQLCEETYLRELDMCRKLNRKNNGKCNWGICSSCGVIPLLIKLYDGVLLENANEISNERNKVFKIR